MDSGFPGASTSPETSMLEAPCSGPKAEWRHSPSVNISGVVSPQVECTGLDDTVSKVTASASLLLVLCLRPASSQLQNSSASNSTSRSLDMIMGTSIIETHVTPSQRGS